MNDFQLDLIKQIWFDIDCEDANPDIADGLEEIQNWIVQQHANIMMNFYNRMNEIETYIISIVGKQLNPTLEKLDDIANGIDRMIDRVSGGIDSKIELAISNVIDLERNQHDPVKIDPIQTSPEFDEIEKGNDKEKANERRDFVANIQAGVEDTSGEIGKMIASLNSTFEKFLEKIPSTKMIEDVMCRIVGKCLKMSRTLVSQSSSGEKVVTIETAGIKSIEQQTRMSDLQENVLYEIAEDGEDVSTLTPTPEFVDLRRSTKFPTMEMTNGMDQPLL